MPDRPSETVSDLLKLLLAAGGEAFISKAGYVIDEPLRSLTIVGLIVGGWAFGVTLGLGLKNVTLKAALIILFCAAIPYGAIQYSNTTSHYFVTYPTESDQRIWTSDSLTSYGLACREKSDATSLYKENPRLGAIVICNGSDGIFEEGSRDGMRNWAVFFLAVPVFSFFVLAALVWIRVEEGMKSKQLVDSATITQSQVGP